MRRSLPVALMLLGMLMFMAGPTFLPAVDILKPVLDAAGKPVLRPGGGLMLVPDKWGQLRVDLPGYAMMIAGAGCVILGIVFLLRPNRTDGRGFDVVMGERPRT